MLWRQRVRKRREARGEGACSPHLSRGGMEQAWWSSGEDEGRMREEEARIDNGVLKNWDDDERGWRA